jgi:hypothetical protein
MHALQLKNSQPGIRLILASSPQLSTLSRDLLFGIGHADEVGRVASDAFTH